MLFSKSKPAPWSSRTDACLKWTSNNLTAKLKKGSIVASLSGLNCSSNLQHIIMPKIFTNAQHTTDIIGNMYDAKGEFRLLQIQGLEIGFGLVVEEFSNIPNELRPLKPFIKKSLEGLPWTDSTVDLGIVTCPLVTPFSFGQEIVQGNIFVDDFKLKMQVSLEHGIWASMITKAFDQHKNPLIIEAIVKKRLGKKSSKFITSFLT